MEPVIKNLKSSYTYTETELANPHIKRSRELIKKYPSIKELMGPSALTAPCIMLVVFLQFLLAISFAKFNVHWALILLVAYTIGALSNHAMFVLLHEASHDLVAKSKWANKLWGIVCNLPQGFPSSIGFRTYHLMHHSHMGEPDMDADLPFDKEAKLVGNSTLKKILWFAAFGIIEAIRPLKTRRPLQMDFWMFLNFFLVIGSNILLFHFFGGKALGYILFSSLFSVGLHPVGARWIQEHYTYREGQETYSYYGILNKFSFNVGYHNEHHDFCRIPWINLPKLKKLAPEYYDNLYYHSSWTNLLLDFIFNNKMTLYKRIIRKNDQKNHFAEEAILLNKEVPLRPEERI